MAGLAFLAGCGGGRGASSLPPTLKMETAKSVSPGSFPVPPMAQTAPQSTAAMARRPQGYIQPPAWTQIPGAASVVAAAPDGTLWVLSTVGPTGTDKFIYHYVGGTWTNISGAASRISVAPDGTLWVVNAAGGIYSYKNGAWSGIAGGASDISVASDGTILVVSSVPGGPYGNGIWHYQSGTWTQMPGAGLRIALSWDQGTYPGGITPGGWYLVNALGSIYYYIPGSGYTQLAGAASTVAPTTSGGLFALGAPNGSGVSSIYYDNLSAGVFAQQPGAAKSLSTDGSTIYVVGSNDGIYSAPLVAFSVAPAPVVGYLPTTPSGGFGGQLGSVTTGATAVAISTTEVNDNGATLGSATINFSLGSTVLSTARRPAAVTPPDAGPHADLEAHPAESPAEIAALQAKLRATTVAGQPAAPRRAKSLGTTVGATASFWVYVFAIGGSSGTYQQVPATLRALGTYGYVWVDDSLSLQPADLTGIAADLDNAYLSDTSHFGATGFTASAPGMSNSVGQNAYTACDDTGVAIGGTVPFYVVPPDSKINAFVINSNGLGAGVGGYFTSTNYYYQAALNCLIGPQGGYTAATVPHSNEAPMFYVGYNTSNSAAFEVGEDLMRGTAHELQHEINFVNHQVLNRGSGEHAWINEGMSMLAQDFAANLKFGLAHDTGDALYRARQFASAPHNYSLTAFAGIDSGTTPKYNCSGCYGAEYLFQRYLYDRFGGDTYLHAMLGGTTNYTSLQNATGVDPHTLISDFAIALAASGTGLTSDARFGISSLNLTTAYPDQFGSSRTVGSPATSPLPSSDSLYQGSFRYYALSGAALNQILSGKDSGTSFGLKMGVVQR